MLDVDIDLTPAPPAEWARGFEHPIGVGISMSMHPPKLSGATVHIRPPDNELERYVAHVDERIVAANDYYEREVLPALNAAEAQDRQRREDAQKRVAEAKRKADELGVTAQKTYATEARAANGRGHHMEGSALDERTAFGRCRDCGAELVISNGGQVTTRPEGVCPGPTR